MIVNYHTHSYHCHHAAGTPEEYVVTAIKNGLEELGFSDHVPYPFSNGHRSGFRMEVEETGTYVEEILELKAKYAGQLKIYVGYEAEYYPAEFEAMLRNIGKYPVDYLICGQHFSRNEYDGYYNGGATEEREKLVEYVDQLTAAMQTGLYTYIAHPDLFNFRGDPGVYREEVLRLCEASIKYDVPLEYNCLGMEGGRHYPRPDFWRLVAESGASTVIGSDAHQPDRTGDPVSASRAARELAGFGIVPGDRPRLHKPVL